MKRAFFSSLNSNGLGSLVLGPEAKKSAIKSDTKLLICYLLLKNPSLNHCKAIGKRCGQNNSIINALEKLNISHSQNQQRKIKPRNALKAGGRDRKIFRSQGVSPWDPTPGRGFSRGPEDWGKGVLSAEARRDSGEKKFLILAV